MVLLAGHANTSRPSAHEHGRLEHARAGAHQIHQWRKRQSSSASAGCCWNPTQESCLHMRRCCGWDRCRPPWPRRSSPFRPALLLRSTCTALPQPTPNSTSSSSRAGVPACGAHEPGCKHTARVSHTLGDGQAGKQLWRARTRERRRPVPTQVGVLRRVLLQQRTGTPAFATSGPSWVAAGLQGTSQVWTARRGAGTAEALTGRALAGCVKCVHLHLGRCGCARLRPDSQLQANAHEGIAVTSVPHEHWRCSPVRLVLPLVEVISKWNMVSSASQLLVTLPASVHNFAVS